MGQGVRKWSREEGKERESAQRLMMAVVELCNV